MYRLVADRFRQPNGEKPGLLGVQLDRAAALPGLLVLRSLHRPGVLEVLESLFADTRYITPPMQR